MFTTVSMPKVSLLIFHFGLHTLSLGLHALIIGYCESVRPILVYRHCCHWVAELRVSVAPSVFPHRRTQAGCSWTSWSTLKQPGVQQSVWCSCSDRTMDRPSSAGHERPSVAPRIHVSDDARQSTVDLSPDSGNVRPPRPASAGTTSRLRVPVSVKGIRTLSCLFCIVSLCWVMLFLPVFVASLPLSWLVYSQPRRVRANKWLGLHFVCLSRLCLLFSYHVNYFKAIRKYVQCFMSLNVTCV